MAATNLTVEELTDSVAQRISERLKLEPDKVITKLVSSLTKNLLKNNSSNAFVQTPKQAPKLAQQSIVQKPLEDIKPKIAKQSIEQSIVQKPLEDTKPKVAQQSIVQKPLEIIKSFFTPLKTEPLKKEPVSNQSKPVIPETKIVEPTKKFIEEKQEKAVKQKDYSEAQASVFEKENAFLFDGFTEKGLTKLKDELPDIIKKGVSGLIPSSADNKKEEPTKPGGNLLGGLGILGGIAGLLALLYGLQTEGPFKGLAKLAGKGLLTISGFTKMFDGVVKKMLRYFIKLPKTILSSFTKMISPMLGTGAGSNLIKTGLTKLTGFLPKFLAGALKFLKKVPFFGSLISIGFAVSRFKSGDVVGGGIEVLSGIAGLFPGIGTGISLALDALNEFLDLKADGSNKEASGKKLNILGEFAGKIGSWLKEKLIDVPIIGPLIKSVTHLVDGDIMKGIKQLAYVVPAFEFIGAMLGDNETTGTTQAVAGGVKQVWEWTKQLGSWIWDKMKSAPIIGPAIKGFKQIFEEGNVIEGLTTMAKGISDMNPLKWLIDWIAGPETVNTAISNTTSVIKDGLGFASDIKNKLLRKVLEFIPEKFLGISLRSRVAEWMGVDMGAVADDPSIQQRSAPEPTPPASENLVVANKTNTPVSLPEQKGSSENSVLNLSTNEGVTAAPAAGSSSSSASSSPSLQDNSNSDDILEKIAQNTDQTNTSLSELAAGFAMLAKAIEKMGTAILEKPVSAPSVLQQSNNQQPTVRSTQGAKAGNKNIANLRQGIELMRQQPA